MRPVEGTILTVARGAAEGAAGRRRRGRVVGRRGRGGSGRGGRGPGPDARAASRAGPGRRGRRRRYGLPAAVRRPARRCLTAGPCPRRPTRSARNSARNPVAPGAARARRAAVDADENLAELRYEVMYLLEAPDDHHSLVQGGVGRASATRSWWSGGDGLWNCHIHTDDVGAAIEASLDAGRPRNIRVTDLLEQVEEERWVREAAATAGSGPSETPTRPPPRHRRGGGGHRRRCRPHLPFAGSPTSSSPEANP